MWVTQMSHIPMNIDYEQHEDWLSMQVRSDPSQHHWVSKTSHSIMSTLASLSFSWSQPVTLSNPPSTTGSVDTSTFRSNTSKKKQICFSIIVSSAFHNCGLFSSQSLPHNASAQLLARRPTRSRVMCQIRNQVPREDLARGLRGRRQV